LGPGAGAIKPTKLKNIEAIIPWPREGEGGVQGDDAAPRGLDPHYLDFIEWVATYTMSDPAAVLRLGLPVDLGAPMPKTRATKKPVGGTAPDPGFHAVTLTSDQQDAARTLTDAVAARRYQTIVLDGVTGSGKTEVYAEAVAAALAQGRQVLVMLPEIALTQTIVARLAKRFGQAPALWHSGLTPAQRRNTYYAIITGRVRVVVGARSALMLPYDDLGLVVIDEEHDPAYKQEDGVLYHARDMAVARAHAAGFPVVLASATPSLETMANAWAGRYTVVRLPDRFGMAVMPEIHLIDLRVDKPASGTFLAPTLRTAIIQTIERGEQVLLFLNRRGYAPLTLCRACGHRFMCPRCTAWMVAHRRTGRLHCHHCGFEMSAPKACPACNTEGAMVACGPGVERIEEEVKTILPQARTLVLSSDLQTDPAQLEAALGQIEARAVDVVIGTQMIAKGHHFPGLTLVGVVDADLGLSGGDLRAAERTFQLLQQVAGRAGRAEKRGLVYLQSFMPDNKVMQALAAGKRDPFLRVEAAERQGASMPPYARLVAIIVSGRDEAAVRNHAAALGRAAPQGIGVKVWGPAEAPLFRIRGRVRMRLLVQADRGVAVQAMVSTWLASTPPPSNIDVRADVDPMGFL
jgi:primosomal protein N' (replication factor Y)